MGEDKRLQAGLYVVAGIFLAEGWQLVIHSMTTRGVLGLVFALAGLAGGVMAGENIRKQSRPTALFWFSFVFHAFSLGFADTPLSAFVSLLIIGSGLPSMALHICPDPSAIELMELAPMVLAFFVAKACAVVGVSHVNKTVLFGVGVIGMSGRIPAMAAEKPAFTSSRPSRPSSREVQEVEEEPFVPASTNVDAQTYTPQWLGMWREYNLDAIQECPAEMQTLKLSSAPAPQGGKGKRKGDGKDKGMGKGKKGYDKGGYEKGAYSPTGGAMGTMGGKGSPWAKPKDDLAPEVLEVVGDGKAEVGDDIRWNIIAEEMARIDAAKKEGGQDGECIMTPIAAD